MKKFPVGLLTIITLMFACGIYVGAWAQYKYSWTYEVLTGKVSPKGEPPAKPFFDQEIAQSGAEVRIPASEWIGKIRIHRIDAAHNLILHEGETVYSIDGDTLGTAGPQGEIKPPLPKSAKSSVMRLEP